MRALQIFIIHCSNNNQFLEKEQCCTFYHSIRNFPRKRLISSKYEIYFLCTDVWFIGIATNSVRKSQLLFRRRYLCLDRWGETFLYPRSRLSGNGRHHRRENICRLLSLWTPRRTVVVAQWVAAKLDFRGRNFREITN